MKENFEIIKAQVCIESVAKYLLGQPVHGLYRFPGERTPSIKIYKETGSFFDFGRAKGGDAVALWAHVCNCDNWTALRELSAFYLSDNGISIFYQCSRIIIYFQNADGVPLVEVACL